MHLPVKSMNFLFCIKLPLYIFFLFFAFFAAGSFNPLFGKDEEGTDKLSPFEKAELKKLVQKLHFDHDPTRGCLQS